MIQINKEAEPDILANNKVNWTKRLLEHIAKGEKVPSSLATNYNSEEVKTLLKTECRDKCMYCESNVAHVAHEHIEHIMPKAKDKYPELTYEWTNLGLACPVCNMNKGSDYDENLRFVNPYTDNPSDFFIPLGHFIYNKPGNQRAELTNRLIDLNRPELIEKRKERLDAIISLIERYHLASNGLLKEAILDEIKVEISIEKPYSLCAESIFNAMMK